jgi:hypothetical protein
MKNNRLKFLLIAFLLIHTYTLNAGMFYSGEKLLYRVSYWGINLGYINIETEGSKKLNNVDVIKTKAYMKSNPDIPFVDLKAAYYSWIDITGAFSHQFIGQVMLSDGTWDYHKIEFEYKEGIIKSKKWIRKKVFFDTTYKTRYRYCDGLSLFFYAREFTKTNQTVKIPTIVDRDTVYTKINFMNKKTKSEIDAVNYDIKTVYFKGSANWTGIYGLTGEFEGWFSDDEASVPIRAKMKVYVGSVDIELVKWQRGGWIPPRAK